MISIRPASFTAWEGSTDGGRRLGCRGDRQRSRRLATAIMAAHDPGVRVCLIDPDARPTSSVGETLPPDVRALFCELGLWEAMLEEEHERCLGSCSAWGTDVLGHNDFVVNPYGHGWHLDRERFDRFLRHHAALSGASVLTGKKVVDADDLGADGHRLWLRRDGAPASSITARYVVDATGIHAAFARARRRAGDSSRSVDVCVRVLRRGR